MGGHYDDPCDDNDENLAPVEPVVVSELRQKLSFFPFSFDDESFEAFTTSQDAAKIAFERFHQNLFFAPPLEDLEFESTDAVWIPWVEGGSCVFPELQELNQGLSRKSWLRGRPKKGFVDGCQVICSKCRIKPQIHQDAKMVVWRPVYLVCYRYLWVSYVALVSGGEMPFVVQLHRPFSYI